MKTKTLLLTVALGAAGIATSMAQVYSANAVGYINVTIPDGKKQMIANQLNVAATTIADLMPSAPEGFQVFALKPDGNFRIGTFAFGSWDDGGIKMTPGIGVFVDNPVGGGNYTVTFVGEVPQGTPLSNPIAVNLSIVSSQVPQAGKISADLGFLPNEGDQVFQYNQTGAGSFDIGTFAFGSWDTEPDIKVGEAFYVSTGTAQNWTRNFSVN